jgi:hypothetical protein
MRCALLFCVALASCGSVTLADVDAGGGRLEAGITGDLVDQVDVALERGNTGAAGDAAAPGLPVITQCGVEATGTWDVEQCPNDCTKAICICTTMTQYGACTRPMQLVGCKFQGLQADGTAGRGDFLCPLTGPTGVSPFCVAACP